MTREFVCFETRSAVRWRVPVSVERIVGSGMSWTFAHEIFVVFELRMIAAVHLRQLVEDRRRVVHVDLEAARVEERELGVVSDADQRAQPSLDDRVDALAHRGPGRDHLERPDEPGLLSILEL